MTWTVAGRAATLPADPGWCVLVVQHDAEGRAVESSPGRTAIQIVTVTHWILVLGLRAPPPEEAAFLSRNTHGAAVVQTSTALYPVAKNGARLDIVKGYRGLSVPGESNDAAMARLIPEGAPIAPVVESVTT